MPQAFPTGISATVFRQIIGELQEVVGREWVFAQEARLNAYNDHYAVREVGLHAPSAAVAPRNVEEIQKILVVARKYRLPLWTVSTGRNLAYGSAAPQRPGSIVLDLKRMNRIL